MHRSLQLVRTDQFSRARKSWNQEVICPVLCAALELRAAKGGICVGGGRLLPQLVWTAPGPAPASWLYLVFPLPAPCLHDYTQIPLL